MNICLSRAIQVGAAIMLSVGTAYADIAAGTIKTVKGEVSIVRAGSHIKASVGMRLVAADKVVTGMDSAVGITLRDTTLLSFGAKSESQLKAFQYNPVNRDGNLLISILQGSMRFVTGMLGKLNPASVNIQTPTSTVGIRGTDFIVSVDGGK